MLLKLNAGQRLALINLLNEFKGELKGVYQIFKILDKIIFSDKEQKGIELKQIMDRAGRFQFTWNPKKDKEKQVELSDTHLTIIKEAIKNKSEKKELTMADKSLLDIAQKIGMNEEMELEEEKAEK